MKVLVNAISIVEGGGSVVLIKLLQEMIQINMDVKWYVTATSNTLSKLPISNQIIKIPYDGIHRSPLKLIFWYEILLPKMIKKLNIDICFSHTNFLPRKKLSCPTLLLIQHAGYFSDHFKYLYLQWYKKKKIAFTWQQKCNWAYSSIKKATAITVQTQALSSKIVDKLHVDFNRIHVISHGTGLLNADVVPKDFPNVDTWRIGYITKFGVQKDFITVFKAIRLFKKNNMPVKLLLTLDKNDRDTELILKQIKYFDIESNVENYGEIEEASQLQNIFQSLHIFIFPSLCESFGFTLVEAMSCALPVVVSDTKSNIEITANSSEIFSKENEKELFEKIYKLMTNHHAYIFSSKKSLERSKQFCWNQAANKILNLLYQLTDKNKHENAKK